MQKTKLGISVGLMGAGLYFLGAISFLPAFLLAAYVLLREENEWLKKAAVQMVAIVIGFNLMTIGVGMIQDVFGVLATIVGWLPFNIRIDVPLDADIILIYVISLFRDLILLVCGFKALSMGSMKVGFVDKLLGKHN